MTSKYKFFLIWLIFITTSIKANDLITINGYVLDLFGQPVSGVLYIEKGDSLYSFPIMPDGSVTGTIVTFIDGFSSRQPEYFKLENNYPNPFDDETRFDVTSQISTAGHIQIYNVLGQQVFSQPILLNPGKTTYNFKASLAAGAYFVRLITPYGTSNQKWIDFSGSKNKPGKFNLSKLSYTTAVFENILPLRLKKSSTVYKIYATGTTQSGDSITVYQALRKVNQDPAIENIATASYGLTDTVFSSMLVTAEQINTPFVLYAIDNSIALDTLINISEPFFRSSWSDIHINRLTRLYSIDSLGAAVSDSVLERQLQIVEQFKKISCISTPLGTDTLLSISQDTISFIDSLVVGSRLWFLNNQLEPAYGRLIQFKDDKWQMTYGETRVSENSPWPVLIKNYTASFAVAIDDYFDRMASFIDLSGLIARPDGKIWRIDERGTAYIRAGLIFKGKQFRISEE